MAVTREEQNRLNRQAAALAAISKHASWPEFEGAIREKIEKQKKLASTIALSDGGANQRKLDQIRGTIGALNWILGVPSHSESTLKRFLEEQGLEVEE